MLTLKQEKFVQGLLNGLSQRQSYKESYSCKNMSDKAIDEEASKLFNNPKVTQRYQRLLDAYASHKVIQRAELSERMLDLLDRATEDTKEKGFKQGNISAMTLAVNTLKELNGLTFADDLAQDKLQLELEKLELAKQKLETDTTTEKDNGSLLRQWFGREKRTNV